jgi:hypothetical protein
MRAQHAQVKKTPSNASFHPIIIHFSQYILDRQTAFYKSTMYWKTLAVALNLALTQNAQAVPAQGLMARQFAQAAMMRFQCSQLVIDRIDPLVQPGMAPSTHLHQIVGGDSFNVSMKPIDYDPSTKATCTTCDYAEDFS